MPNRGDQRRKVKVKLHKSKGQMRTEYASRPNVAVRDWGSNRTVSVQRSLQSVSLWWDRIHAIRSQCEKGGSDFSTGNLAREKTSLEEAKYGWV